MSGAGEGGSSKPDPEPGLAAQGAASAGVVGSPQEGCPIDDSFLSEAMRKHVDPKSPVPLRMMAAKGLVPLSGSDLVQAQFMLVFDPDPEVQAAALQAASAIPERLASSAFRDEEIPAPVLGWLLSLHVGNPVYAEMLTLNGSTPDSAIAAAAGVCARSTAQIIGDNQLRILREPEIIRHLATNPNAAGALLDGVCDFAVRSGLFLPEVEAMARAEVRLFGAPRSTSSVSEEVTADAVLADLHDQPEGGDTHELSDAEWQRRPLYSRVSKMSVAERIKLATKGNKECRDLLIRDPNKLVAVAVIRSARISEGEVTAQASSKTAYEEVLRVILANREWMRKYPVRLALVKNPKVSQGVAMRLMGLLRDSDVKSLSRDKNVATAVQIMARRLTEKKSGPGRKP